MADLKNPHLEVLELQAAVAQLQAQLLGTQAELAKYKHQELMAAVSQLQRTLSLARLDSAALDADSRQQLMQIAAMSAEQLPQIVTKQLTEDDGSPKIGPDGKVMLVRQDGSPLSLQERAILARADELRLASQLHLAAGGQA